jgi:hypothetical protein
LRNKKAPAIAPGLFICADVSPQLMTRGDGSAELSLERFFSVLATYARFVSRGRKLAVELQFALETP